MVSSDYYDDLRIGPEIIKRQTDHYRRIRNTLRYLLGAVNSFDKSTEAVPVAEMPELERWVLHRLTSLTFKFVKRHKPMTFMAFSLWCMISVIQTYQLSISMCVKTVYIVMRQAQRTGVLAERLWILLCSASLVGLRLFCVSLLTKLSWLIQVMKQTAFICTHILTCQIIGTLLMYLLDGRKSGACVQRLWLRWKPPVMMEQ